MEIEITDSDLRQFNRNGNLDSALPSLDVYFEISAASSKEIANNNFDLVVNMIMPQGCSTYGRFFDFLEKPQKERIMTFLKEEEGLFKKTKFVESSYVPHMSRGANVAIHANLREYAIDLGRCGKGNIHLRDLYVGADLSRLYITLKDGEEELIITSGNLLNPTHAPIPLRFVRDVSKMQFVQPIPWSWGRLDNVHFLPRIRYGKTILSPAQWYFDIRTEPEIKTPEQISNSFQRWANLWNMPNEVCIGLDDQRLYVDRSHPTFLALITKEIKKNKMIHLREKFTNAWWRSDQGTHCSEFVLSFRKKTPYIPPHNDIRSSFKSSHADSRFKLPGSEWSFVKLYLARTNENEFLTNHLLPFLQPFIQSGNLKNWFFVRYQDPLNHLRIRFNGDPQFIQEILEPSLKKWLHKIFQAQIINDIAFATYEREVERYGGEELIPIAEAMFGDDTRIALALIRAIKDKKISIPEHIIGALSIIDLVKGFDLNFDKLLNFLTPASNAKTEALTGARQWKDKLPNMIKLLFEPTLLNNEHADLAILHSIFSQRRDNQNNFLTTIRKMKSEGNIQTSFASVINSLIHMHLNRFIGVEPDKELKVRLYAHYGLSNLAFQNVHKKVTV